MSGIMAQLIRGGAVAKSPTREEINKAWQYELYPLTHGRQTGLILLFYTGEPKGIHNL